MTKKDCLHIETTDVGVDNGYIIERCIECHQLLRTKIRWDGDLDDEN